MGTCEDSCPCINVVNEINLEIDSHGAHSGHDHDCGDSSEQVLVQKLENAHLEEEEEEEKLEGQGDEVEGVEEEDKENDGASEEGEEEKEEQEDEKEEGQQNENGDQPYPLRPHAVDCSFYMKTGSCKFGQNCRFNHPLNRVNQLVDMDSKEYDAQGTDDSRKIECKYYGTPGGCKYGDTCKYRHSKEKTDHEQLELNFLGLPIRMGEKECPYYMRNGSCGYGANCRFHHPDPTAAMEEPKNPIANGGAPQGGKSFAARNNAEIVFSMPSMPQSISTSSSSENLPSYVPWMNSLPQGMPQIPQYNSYQVPVSQQDNNLNSQPSQYVTSPLKKVDSFGHKQQLMQNDEFPERPGQPECDYFMKTGTCKFQSACRYHHPISRYSMPNGVSHNHMKEASQLTHFTEMVPMDEYPERPGQLECAFFMKTGQCKFKSGCKYHHPKNRFPKLAASMYSMSSLPSGSAPALSLEAKKLPDSFLSHLNQTTKPFKHLQPTRIEEFPERPGQPDCEYFMKTGDCKYKSACRYHHPKGAKSQVATGSECALNEKGLPLRPGANICWNYEQLGICKYGPRCLFDHPANYDSSTVSEPPPTQTPPGNYAGSEDWGDGWVIG